jgi:hypothetical protein
MTQSNMALANTGNIGTAVVGAQKSNTLLYLKMATGVFVLGTLVNIIYQASVALKQRLSINNEFIRDSCIKFDDEGVPHFTNKFTDKESLAYKKCQEFLYERDIFRFSRILCIISCILAVIFYFIMIQYKNK